MKSKKKQVTKPTISQFGRIFIYIYNIASKKYSNKIWVEIFFVIFLLVYTFMYTELISILNGEFPLWFNGNKPN